jgi:hypothetical protein
MESIPPNSVAIRNYMKKEGALKDKVIAVPERICRRRNLPHNIYKKNEELIRITHIWVYSLVGRALGS